jgi:hypothetical protein
MSGDESGIYGVEAGQGSNRVGNHNIVDVGVMLFGPPEVGKGVIVITRVDRRIITIGTVEESRKRIIIVSRIRRINKRSVNLRARLITWIKEINSRDDGREFISRMRSRELRVKSAHFCLNVHNIFIIRFVVFSGKISGVVDGCNTIVSEWSVSSVLNLFESIGTSKAIRRKAKEMPAASNTMGRGITDTTNVGRM